MRIGLIDVDNRDKLYECYPNLALMKIAAWHKAIGDSVEWYDPMFGGRYDRVYMSKVFSFTDDYPYHVNADEVIKGGSGYCITLEDGREVFDKEKDFCLPNEIEHTMPDYSIYFNDNDLEYDDVSGECLGLSRKEKEKRDTAYGFMSRGCPRGCSFCHVAAKEGRCSKKVADLSEFWNGQKNIVLMDANTLACKDWEDILGQLKESGAYVDFNQGIDIRLITEEKALMLKDIKTKYIHFAFDRYEDKDIIVPKMKMLKDVTGWNHGRVSVYILCGYDTTMEQNLERIQLCRELDFSPYVMLYNKQNIPRGHELRKLQRWCNNRFVFWSCDSFEKYMKE